MSNSNLSSRTAPKIRLSDNPEEDFNFYMQFVTPLVSKLIEEKERKLAVEWIKKLTDDKRNPGLRTEYLLLLFFALQRRHLSGPFQSSPSQTECLQPFENNLDMFQMMERMVKEKRKPTMNPPYYSEVSGDFKEYVVTQEIPNFGVHCYMATSNEPLQKWKNSHLANIPKETTAAEAYENRSRSSFETTPAQQGSAQCTPPSTPQTQQFEKTFYPIRVRDSIEPCSEYSVNLQTLRGLVPRTSYVPNEDMYRTPSPYQRPSAPYHQAERVSSGIGQRVPAPSSVQGGPAQADNPPRASSNPEEEKEYLSAMEKLSNGELERLVAEFEEKLRPETSEESSILSEASSPDPIINVTPRPQARNQAGTRMPSRTPSASQTERNRVSRSTPAQKPRHH